VSIAYQTFGSGPDVVYVAPGAQNIELAWEDPDLRRMFDRFGSFCRFTQFDKRGTGLSDRDVGVAPIDERADDMRAVMDAAGIERAFLFGLSEGGPLSILFTATYPDRVHGLVLLGTAARLSIDAPPELVDQFYATWGTPESLVVDLWAPSRANDQEFRRRWARYMRHAGSPSANRRLAEMNNGLDVRAVLPVIAVPTLVMHRIDDSIIPVSAGRRLAAGIPGARLVEVPGVDHFPQVGDQDAWLDELEEFVTGTRPTPPPARMLATVLFTDIVDSTRRASDEGDRKWRDLLDAHDATARTLVDDHAGRLVKSTGDGILAVFDSPARALRCARGLVEGAVNLGIEIRAGLHAGEIEIRGDDVGGIAVHTAARVEGLAAPGEILASRTVKDLVAGAGFDFADRGTHRLKGLEDDWQLLALVGEVP
jgi:class 3 adenylate cyclase/pimeloyl-ACP methyl ester carboxylesterase